MLVEQSLYKAIKFFDNKQINLAKAINEKPDKIRYWLNNTARIPLHNAIAIEAATNGRVSRYDLAPYARCTQHVNHHHQITPSISEKVIAGITFEKSIADLKINGRKDVHAAKHAGFGNHVTYRQAKSVVQHGTFNLIQAMEAKQISISIAAIIAIFLPDQQEKILQLNKKQILQFIKNFKRENCK